MKRSAIFGLVLVSLGVLSVRNACAGSAVAIGPHNQLATSYGYPKEIAKQRALEIAHRRYGADVRILAATDIYGYGAIAVAHHGIGWVTGVALGRQSAAEAENLAIQQCRKAGGTNPQVKWAWKG
jgi:hypothetical protein